MLAACEDKHAIHALEPAFNIGLDQIVVQFLHSARQVLVLAEHGVEDRHRGQDVVAGAMGVGVFSAAVASRRSGEVAWLQAVNPSSS